MTSKLRLALPMACIGVLGAVCFLLFFQSHANARVHMNYAHLNKIQKRIISETLANFIAPQSTSARSHIVVPNDNDGGGVDGAPFTPPKSFQLASGGGSTINYFPASSSGSCSQNIGNNVKVNQNCLNLSDPSLQGRGQANNEPSISVDPFNSRHLVASDNNYIRGDGTCGSYFSLNGGRTWSNTTIPNGFTIGPPGFAREYWQAGGDTSVAWDTRGNAYESCQLFNRGSGTSPNPDDSSTFVLFRATQNNGGSWNFTGRYSVPAFFDPTGASGGAVLQDKALMTIDDNVNSPFRDRIYVTWTAFAIDGSAFIYEVHSDDYGETFSKPVLVSGSNPNCTNTFGVTTTVDSTCNENQFSDPFVGEDGNLYVAFDNFNNQPTSGSNNNYQVLLAKSTDGGASFSAPVQVSRYYDLPDCDTYQGAGADPGRSCVVEKGSSTKSVFRATNYPSGQVDPSNGDVAVTFGSYINKDSNETNGCAPTGFASDGNPTYTGVKTAGACANKILLSVSTNGGASFSGTGADPRTEELVTQSPGQTHTDQFWQWSAFTGNGTLAVDYYDRQYGTDETTGSSDFSLSGSSDLTHFGQTRVTPSSMPAPTQFEGPNGGQFYGDYVWLSASQNKAYPIWSDTRATDLFLCPGTGTVGNPPQVCDGIETNGETANDEETYMAAVNVPTANGHRHGH